MNVSKLFTQGKPRRRKLAIALAAACALPFIGSPVSADEPPLFIYAMKLTDQQLAQVKGQGGDALGSHFQQLANVILWDEGGGKNKLYFEISPFPQKGNLHSFKIVAKK